MSDSVFTIIFDDSPAKAATDRSIQGMETYADAIEAAGKEAEAVFKKIGRAAEQLGKTQERYSKTQTDTDRMALSIAQGVEKALSQQYNAYTKLIGELEKYEEALDDANTALQKVGYEKQAKDLAHLQGQLKGFVAAKQEEMELLKTELALKERRAKLNALITPTGRAYAAENAALKATLDTEQKLATLRAQSLPHVLANLKAIADLQHKQKGAVEAAAAAAKVQADAEVKLAEARAKNSDQIVAMTKETKELEEATKHLTMTSSQQASAAERDYRQLIALKKQLGSTAATGLGDDMLKDYVKLQRLASKFYDTNDEGLKKMLARFKQVSQQAMEGFRTGKGTSDYIAQLQVLLKEMGKFQTKSAKMAEGIDQIDDEAGDAARALKRLESQVRGTTTSFSTLNKVAGLSRNVFDALGRHISIYGGGMVGAAAATYGAVRGIREAITVYVEFTEKLQRASAVMSASIAQTQEMGQHARDLAKVTVFTATETAEALVQLGMAGLSSAEAMGALEPTLQIASIGALDFGKAADIATNIMHGFNLESQDITRVVDVMAQAITSSNASMEQMGNTLSYVAPIASAYGVSLEAVAASAEVLHNAGIKGSRAGTGLRRSFMKLFNPTAAGAKALKTFGVEAVNAFGSTRPLLDVLEEIAAAMDAGKGSITELADIVGVRASTAFITLVESARTGVKTFEEVEGALKSLSAQTGTSVSELRKFYNANLQAAGSAKTMQKVIEDTLGADWDKLVSALNEVALQLMDAFGPDIREAIQGVTEYFVELTEDSDRIKAWADSIRDVAESLKYFVGILVAGKIAEMLLRMTKGLAGFSLGLGALKTAQAQTGAGMVQLAGSAGILTEAFSALKIILKGGAIFGGVALAAYALVEGTIALAEALGLRYEKEKALSELPDRTAEEIAANRARLQSVEDLVTAEKELTDARAAAQKAAGKVNELTEQIEQLEALKEKWEEANEATGAYGVELAKNAKELESFNNYLDAAISKRDALNKTAGAQAEAIGVVQLKEYLSYLEEIQRSAPETIARLQRDMQAALDAGAPASTMESYQVSIQAVIREQEGLNAKILETQAQLREMAIAGEEAGRAVIEGGAQLASALQGTVLNIHAALSKFDMAAYSRSMPVGEARELETAIRGLKTEYLALVPVYKDVEDKQERQILIYDGLSEVSKGMHKRLEAEPGLLGAVTGALKRHTTVRKKATVAAKDFSGTIADLNAQMAEFSGPAIDLTPQQELVALNNEYKGILSELLPLMGQINARRGDMNVATAKAKSLIGDLNKVDKERSKLLKDIATKEKQQAKHIETLAKKYSKTLKAQIEYNEASKELQELAKAMPQHIDLWVDAQERLNEAFASAQLSEFEKKLEEFGKAFEKLDEAGAQWLDSLSDKLTDFITTGKADFKGFFDGIIRDIVKMSVQDMIFNVGTIFTDASGGSSLASIFEGIFKGPQSNALKVAKDSKGIQQDMLGELRKISSGTGSDGALGTLAEDIAAKFKTYQTSAGGLSALFSTSGFDEMPGVAEDFVAGTDVLMDAGLGMQQAAQLMEQSAEFGAAGLAATLSAFGGSGGAGAGGILQALTGGGGGGSGLGGILNGISSLFSGGSGLLAGAGSFLESALFMSAPFESITAAGITATGVLGEVGGAISGIAGAFSSLLPVVGLAIPLISSLFADDPPSYAFETGGGLGESRFLYTEDIEQAELQKIKALLDEFDAKVIASLTAAQRQAADDSLANLPTGKRDIRDAASLGVAVLDRYRNAFTDVDQAFSQAFQDIATWGSEGELDSEVILTQASAMLEVWKRFGESSSEIRSVVDSLGAWNADAATLADTLAKTFAIAQDFVEGAGIFSIEAFKFDSLEAMKEAFSAFSVDGEILADTVVRITGEVMGLADSLELAGQSIHEVDEGMKDLVTSAAGLVQAAGGLTELNKLNAYYFENFLTAEEQRAKKIEIATKQITRLNDTLGFTGDKAITTKAQLRGVIEGLDLMGAEGQELYVALIRDLAPAVIELEGLLNSTAEGVSTTTTALEAMLAALERINVEAPEGGMADFVHQWFQELGGEFEALIPAIDTYYQLVFSEEERRRHTMESAQVTIDAFNTELGLFGSSAIQSTASLRRYVDAMDLSSAAQRDLFARIMTDLVPAVQSLNEELDVLMEKFSILQEIAYALDIPDPGTNSSILALQEFFAMTGDDRLVAGLDALNQALQELADARAIRELEEVFGGALPQNMGEFAAALAAVDTATAAGMESFKEMISALPDLQTHWAALIDEIKENIRVLDQLADSYRELSESIAESIQGLINSSEELTRSTTALWAIVRNLSLSFEERLSAAQDLHDLIMENYRIEEAAIRSAYDAKIRAIEEWYREEMALYEELENAVKDLKKFIQGLSFSDYSPLDPGQQLTAAAARFQELLAAARSGDPDAILELQQAAQDYLEAARAVYGSNPEYVRIFEMITAALQDISNPLEDPTEEYERRMAEALDEMNAALAALQAATIAELEELQALVDAILAEIEAEKAAEEARLERLLEGFQDVRDVLRDAFLNAGENITAAILEGAQHLPPEQQELLARTISALQDVQAMVERMGTMSVEELAESGADLDAMRESMRVFLSLYELMQDVMPEQASQLEGLAESMWAVAEQLGITPEEIGVGSGVAELDIGASILTGFEGMETDLALLAELLTEINSQQSTGTEAVTATIPLLTDISTEILSLSEALNLLGPEVSAGLLAISQQLTEMTDMLTQMATGSTSIAQAIRDLGVLVVTELTNLQAANDGSLDKLVGMDANIISLVDRMETRSAEAREQSQTLEAEIQRNNEVLQETLRAVGSDIVASVQASESGVTTAVQQTTQAQIETGSSVATVVQQTGQINSTLSTIAEQNRQILSGLSSKDSGDR